jgi:ABC-2 type transport system permease protein
MRSWSEERKSGSIELLMTLPISPWQAMFAKFLAAWAVLGLSLLLTFPLWLTVNYLGSPDNGIIVAAYVGSWLMAGGFLAIGLCIWAPALVIDTVASFSFLTHFEAMAKGVIALDDLGYFLLVIVTWLFAGLVLIEQKKAD